MTATLHQAAKFFFGGEHLQLVTGPQGKCLLQLWIPCFLKTISLKEKTQTTDKGMLKNMLPF